LSIMHMFAFLLFVWLYRRIPRDSSYSDDTDHSPKLLSLLSDDGSSDALPDKSNSFSELEKKFPQSTAEERERFLVAKKGNAEVAAKYLQAYLEWRFIHESVREKLDELVSTGDSDHDDWNIAAAIAMKERNENQSAPLTRVARTHSIGDREICDVDGRRIIHITPGLMDDRLASLTTYALSIALYIDRKLERHSLERVTVLIDARGGQGWRNNHAVHLLPFIQHISKLLLSMFPERLSRSLVYPLPPAFGWIWNVAQRWIDPLTRDKICLLTGPATIASPPPSEQMAEYLGKDVVEILEKHRVAAFLPVEPC